MDQPMTHQQLRTRSQCATACPRHPTDAPVTGFCASCLRERLAGIDPSTHLEIPSSSILRRCKSSSSAAARRGGSSAEPRRRSCDSRARGTLSDLFDLDDADGGGKCSKGDALFELREEEEEENEMEEEEEEEEIRVFERSVGGEQNVVVNGSVDEGFDGEGELKTMKEFIDLEWENKKQARKNIKGLWEVASVLSRRLGKWRGKQGKMKRQCGAGFGSGRSVEATGNDTAETDLRRFREARSEVGEYGLGRRSCDTDPRCSVDAGRVSVDVQCSFDKHRASWDGHLIGRSCQYPQLNPMVSFLEDVKVIDIGFKGRVLAEDKSDVVDEEVGRSPGGSVQTRDYYKESFSSQRRRRSLDRSNSSVRKGSLVELDDMKLLSNTKVSLASTELFYGAKLLIAEEDLRGSSSKSSNDDHVETTEYASKDLVSAVGGLNEKRFKKLNRWRKAWNVWGLIQRKSESKCGDGERRVTENAEDRPQVANAEATQFGGQKLVRNCSVSVRNSFKMDESESVDGPRNVERKGIGTRIRDEPVLMRNRSVKYSPNNLDNGLLRFYLTPSRSYGSKSVKSRLKKAHSLADDIV